VLNEWLHGLTAQTADAPGGLGMLGSAIPFILIFGVMYFLIIRPQQKQAKEQQTFLGKLAKGDEVVLQSGFFGKVFAVGEGDVTVEIAPNVKVKVLKSAVVGPSPLALVKAEGEKRTDTEKKS
jgi:preprotein translocase subunit YajC